MRISSTDKENFGMSKFKQFKFLENTYRFTSFFDKIERYSIGEAKRLEYGNFIIYNYSEYRRIFPGLYLFSKGMKV